MTETCSASTKLWVSALLIVIVISILTAFAYTSSNDALKDSVRQGMKSTAAVMATQINASDLAGIKPGDETSPRYLAVVRELRTMRSLDDNIINAYILNQPGQDGDLFRPLGPGSIKRALHHEIRFIHVSLCTHR
jgi:hypothetical protein